MAKVADIGSKRLIGLAPETWVKWVTQQEDVRVVDFLNSDFQWVSRENDVLLRVQSTEHGEFLVLNELQLRCDPRMPRRIRAYVALAEERYNLPIYPVLVNILPPSGNPKIPTSYRSEFLGLQAVQDYRVINLWEVDVEIVFRDRLSALLPFVPVLRGGNQPDVIRQAVGALREDQQLQELEPLLSFFASFVLESDLVRQIMRWDMVVLRESPWYQEILKEGLQQGLQQGQMQVVMRQLSRRLGEIPLDLRQQIEGLSEAEIDELLEASLTQFESLQDLRTWLTQANR
ncbi:MAG: DUF4351 domain-containing protein [Phormidium sp. GEM2.Bin31]|nr:MAG: DUF4351 domain-containing protein [Phormidium sp. GEM2.Bin31]